jgi:glycosyltransferase involved in cell wall biosynthesis
MSISIIIPAYNAKSTIFDAVDSALRQTLAPDEIMVVDDGSTDGTGEAVTQKYGAQVRVIRQSNAGVAEARNHGIDVSTGSYLQFLDADDMLDASKLERSLAACQNASASVSYSQALFVGADGRTPISMNFPTLPSGEILTEWLTGTMANGSYGVMSSMFVTRDALLQAGRFETSCTPCEDWDMWIRLATRNRFAALNAPLVTYRVSPGSLSSHMLRLAKGRLTVVCRARELPDVQAQLSAAVLDRLEAGRWHVYAMRLWENGQRHEAREAFAAADRLAPSPARALYRRMSYILPASSTALFERVLQMRRKNKPQGSGPNNEKTLS